jgi:hypothetical protein
VCCAARDVADGAAQRPRCGLGRRSAGEPAAGNAEPQRCAPPAAGEVVQHCAPDLPQELMHAVLLPLLRDIPSLSAAAGVSKSWRAAALHPHYWANLQAPSYQHCPRSYYRFQKLTDEHLAVLVRRSCGFDPDGNEHKLFSLNVSQAPNLTLRGVLAALGAPRDDAGTPLLRDALDYLHVAGARITEEDVEDADELLAELQSYLRPGGFRRLDVDRLAQCTNENCHCLLGLFSAAVMTVVSRCAMTASAAKLLSRVITCAADATATARN